MLVEEIGEEGRSRPFDPRFRYRPDLAEEPAKERLGIPVGMEHIAGEVSMILETLGEVPGEKLLSAPWPGVTGGGRRRLRVLI
jgi:hypothetical protein